MSYDHNHQNQPLTFPGKSMKQVIIMTVIQILIITK